MTLRSNIPQLRASLPDAAARGVARAAFLVEDLAKQLCPVDTGALRASIRVTPTAPALRMAVIATQAYAAHVEYGTLHSPAQPFLTPAARAIKVQREITAELRAVIQRSRIR